MFGIKTNYTPSRERMERIIDNIKARRKRAQAQERALTIIIDGEVVPVRSD